VESAGCGNQFTAARDAKSPPAKIIRLPAVACLLKTVILIMSLRGVLVPHVFAARSSLLTRTSRNQKGLNHCPQGHKTRRHRELKTPCPCVSVVSENSCFLCKDFTGTRLITGDCFGLGFDTPQRKERGYSTTSPRNTCAARQCRCDVTT